MITCIRFLFHSKGMRNGASMPWRSQLLNIVLAKENTGILGKTCSLQCPHMHQDFSKGNCPSMRKEDTKYEQIPSTAFCKRKPITKSWRKTTAEAGKKGVRRTSKGREKDARFLRQPEELPRVQKPARQGKGTHSLQYFTYIFFCFR